MFLKKNNRKILVISLIFILTILFCSTAKASTLSSNISSIFNFINNKIIGQIKNDFCRQYILSISNGEWKDGELRTRLGNRVCTSYSVPKSTIGKITQETLQNLNGSNSFSKTETPSTSSINNPTPDVYAPNLTTSGADLNASQIIYLTNLERNNSDSNLVNLKVNNILKNIAAIRVKDMFAYSYFDHTSPAGDNASKEAVKNGYSYITIGENIALGNFDGAKGVIASWMNSPGHRANILNRNYTEIGVYAMQGTYKGQNVWIAAQIFGKPILGCKEPDNTLKDKIAKYKVSAESILNNIKSIDAELKTISTLDTGTYNSKVAERNTLAVLYNSLATEIKVLVAEYNKEASAYNSCIKTI